MLLCNIAIQLLCPAAEADAQVRAQGAAARGGQGRRRRQQHWAGRAGRRRRRLGQVGGASPLAGICQIAHMCLLLVIYSPCSYILELAPSGFLPHIAAPAGRFFPLPTACSAYGLVPLAEEEVERETAHMKLRWGAVLPCRAVLRCADVPCHAILPWRALLCYDMMHMPTRLPAALPGFAGWGMAWSSASGRAARG